MSWTYLKILKLGTNAVFLKDLNLSKSGLCSDKWLILDLHKKVLCKTFG
jgi:hypothetical protein